MVQGPGEFPVRGSRSVEFVGSLLQLTANFGELLFQVDDPPLQLVDVNWDAEPGVGPGRLAQGLGEPLLQLADLGLQAGVTFQCVGQIRLERGPADGGLAALQRRRCRNGVDSFEQVTLTIEECAVHSCRAGERGDK
ncbi:hypothetical protein [Streptomyces mirabilis]|uniref:hypothetical protein n=1 Tax=Streptomyces mirabilis TaxID=68239 RepID=UPI00331BA3C8